MQSSPYRLKENEEVDKFLRQQLENYGGQHDTGEEKYAALSRELEPEIVVAQA